ncbi:hypothetical protein Ciccas_002384 [Cichlidogyrus casuarinus]|uniref:DUF4201 domain-containing protein n=1 Tax=Cichlidogyrus casuarinus TaxID=1844966 RepID=A0ABD2QHE2_9PLAT
MDVAEPESKYDLILHLITKKKNSYNDPWEYANYIATLERARVDVGPIDSRFYQNAYRNQARRRQMFASLEENLDKVCPDEAIEPSSYWTQKNPPLRKLKKSRYLALIEANRLKDELNSISDEIRPMLKSTANYRHRMLKTRSKLAENNLAMKSISMKLLENEKIYSVRERQLKIDFNKSSIENTIKNMKLYRSFIFNGLNRTRKEATELMKLMKEYDAIELALENQLKKSQNSALDLTLTMENNLGILDRIKRELLDKAVEIQIQAQHTFTWEKALDSTRKEQLRQKISSECDLEENSRLNLQASKSKMSHLYKEKAKLSDQQSRLVDQSKAEKTQLAQKRTALHQLLSHSRRTKAGINAMNRFEAH